MRPPQSEQDPEMTNPHKGRQGLDRIIFALRNSIAGLDVALREESAFRQESVLMIVLLPASVWLANNWIEWALLAGSGLLVLIVELLNTAVESAIDRVSFDFHALSRRAKDVGSAAVLLALLLCGGIWIAALWSRLIG
jgi:diacylglycerol kinase (ATP)